MGDAAMRFITMLVLAFWSVANASAQGLFWYPTMSGGGYGPPQSSGVAACYISHQSYIANAGIKPNQFTPGYNSSGDLVSTWCQWERGGPGYWGTSGSAFLQCPPNYVKSGDDNSCVPNLQTAGGCPIELDRQMPVVANPIAVVPGAKLQLERDFRVGRGRLEFVRSYSSFLTDPTRMGRGWASNFHPQVEGAVGAAGRRLTFRLESGEVLRFRGGSWKQAGISTWNGWRETLSDARQDLLGYRVEEVSTSLLILHDPQGVERHFALSSSYNPRIRMTKIRYSDGYEINLAYDSVGSLLTATDTDGYQIGFGYDARNRLASVTAPDGSVYRYEYEEFPGTIDLADAGSKGFGWLHFSRLSKVIYPDDTPANDADNPYVQYHYEDEDFPAALTGRTDERGVRVRTWGYDFVNDRLRAISSAGPLGRELTTIAETVNNAEYTVTNALGKQSIYKAATIGKSRKITEVEGVASASCLASNSTSTFNSAGQLTQTVGEEGQTRSITVDTAYDLPTQIVDGAGTPNAVTTQLTWDTALRKPTQIIRPDLTIDLSYDTSGNPTTITQTDTTSQTVPYSTNGQQRIWTFSWGADGLLQSLNGPITGAADTESYTYDASGNIATITNEVGHVTTVNSVDDMGRPLQITEPSGRVTAFTYTPRGWAESITINPGPSQRVLSFTYDAAGNLTRIDFPGSRWTEYDYDLSGWLTEARSSAGGKIQYGYDLLGNVTTAEFLTTGGSSRADFAYTYDELGRLRSLLGGGGDALQQGYDRSDRLSTETDGLGRTWLTAFDALDRAISVTDPELDVEQTDWSTSGHVAAFEDGRALTTSFVRNGFGEIIREVSPDRGTTDYWYDSAGRLTKVLTDDGRDTRYTYDAAGRLLTRTFPNDSSLDLAFTYDSVAGGNAGKGELTSIAGSVSTRSYTYNLFGEMTGESWALDMQIYDLEYGHSSSGDLTAITYPSGRTVEYTQDSAGRIVSVGTRASALGALVPIISSGTYEPFGPLTGYTFGNGVSASIEYDASYRLDRILLTGSSGAVLDKSYTYDANSRVTSIVDAVTPSATATYTYHLDGRLRRATGVWGDREWTYDAVGNRILQEDFSGGSFLSSLSYNYPSDSNKVLGAVSDQNVTLRSFTHTADGNISLETRPGVGMNYAYNEAGRLESITRNASLDAEFAYDAFERRIWRSTPADGVRHFVFLPDGRLIGEYDGLTGAVILEYIWMDDHLVGNVDASGTVRFVQTGPLGQPLIVMNASGMVVWRGELSPFGELVTSTVTGPVPEARFLGQWDEAGSGLYQNWHRTYDASLGRYLEADPLGLAAGQSLYGYAGQDPVNAVDPEGLQTYLEPGLTPEEKERRATEETIGPIFKMMGGDTPNRPPFTTNIAENARAAALGLPPVEYTFEQFCIDAALDEEQAAKSVFKRLFVRPKPPMSQPELPIPGSGPDRKYLAPGGRAPNPRG